MTMASCNAVMNVSIPTMKAAIREELNGQGIIVQQFMELCKNCDKGIAYHYVGTTTGKTCIVQIESYELGN